jgi:hypothetical protein
MHDDYKFPPNLSEMADALPLAMILDAQTSDEHEGQYPIFIKFGFVMTIATARAKSLKNSSFSASDDEDLSVEFDMHVEDLKMLREWIQYGGNL